MIDWSHLPANRTPATFRNLSHREREATPYLLARYLVRRIQPHAALWVMRKTVYGRFRGLELWDGGERNAREYPGPGPIIAHPPCGPWGKYRHACIWQEREDGIRAIELVHEYGGVVEQPLGSHLFRLYGRGGKIERINQYDYGHKALKPTLLYFVE